jgi:phage-related protein
MPLYTKDGYHISGWNETPDGFSSSWFSGQTYTWKRASDVDLYAIWAGDEYIVHYREEGGSDDIHVSKAVYGSPFYTDRVPYPEDKAYYSFDGWLADDGTIFTRQGPHFDAFTYGQDPVWSLKRDLIIERQWSPNYPFGKIMFGGEYSDQYGIYVETFPSDTWPEYEYGHHKVYGKNGDVLTDPKRFNNVSRKYKISAYDYNDYRSVAKKVSEWLHKTISNKYIRLEDSYEPDIYRMAVYEESNELENLLGVAGKCEIEFNCKPQKFLISGDEGIEITEDNQIIHNPTDRDASPLITIYGSGKVHINDSTLEIIQSFNNVTFDAESYDAIDFEGYIMNSFVYTEDNIVLKPGDNIISTEGNIVRLCITPRWWRI